MESLQATLDMPVKDAPAGDIDAAKLAPIKINLAWCKGCDICSALCPRCVIEPDWERKPVIAHPEECTQCGICWMHCPDFAITSNFN